MAGIFALYKGFQNTYRCKANSYMRSIEPAVMAGRLLTALPPGINLPRASLCSRH